MNADLANNGIWAIIVTHNRLGLLKECLEALRSQTVRPECTLVVNNGSTDGTKEWLDVQADVKVVHQANLGGSGGFYAGMKHAYEAGGEYFWLMDDDVLAQSNALEELVKALHTVGENSFVSSRVVCAEDRSMNLPVLDLRTEDPHEPDWDRFLGEGIVKVCAATFVSVLINRETVRSVGYPIKEMFIWYDDIEFTMRCTRYAPGYFAGKSVVRHLRTGSARLEIWAEPSPQRLRMFRYLYRNKVFYMTRYSPHSYLSVLKYCTKLLVSTTKWTLKEKRILPAWIICKGVMSGFFFNPAIDRPVQ